MVLDWDLYFLEMAKTASKRSNCLRAQVGAIIVGDDKTIRATGYNGTPSKVESCMERNYCYRVQNNIPSGTRYETCRSIHAEQNAIIQAGLERCKNSTMYIYGHNFVCILCKCYSIWLTKKTTNQNAKYNKFKQNKISLSKDLTFGK